MDYAVRQRPDGEFDIVMLRPVRIGTFVDLQRASRVAAFLNGQEPDEPRPDVSATDLTLSGAADSVPPQGHLPPILLPKSTPGPAHVPPTPPHVTRDGPTAVPKEMQADSLLDDAKPVAEGAASQGMIEIPLAPVLWKKDEITFKADPSAAEPGTAVVPVTRPATPAVVRKDPRAPAVVQAEPTRLTDAQREEAFRRLGHGEKLAVVAPDFGLSMQVLRAMWAGHKSSMQRFHATGGQIACALCHKPFMPSETNPDTCARCSKAKS